MHTKTDHSLLWTSLALLTLTALLLTATPHASHPLRTCAANYSQFGQDAYLRHNIFPHAAPGYYIDLGAYDPLRLSNTAVFDRCYGWRGLCIDMNPFHAAAFKQHRTCDFLHTCVAANRTYLDYYPTDSDLSNGREGVSRVTCEPFDAILRRHNVPSHVQLLTIDIEGWEVGALQGFPFDRIQVDAILVETWHVGKAPVFDWLEDRGYRHVAEIGPDDLFVWGGAAPWLPDRYHEWRKAVRSAERDRVTLRTL
jgi:FkbM family methyltransferase